MNYPEIVIYNYNQLFDILNELSKDINFKFVKLNKNEIKQKKDNIFILSKQKLKDHENYLY